MTAPRDPAAGTVGGGRPKLTARERDRRLLVDKLHALAREATAVAESLETVPNLEAQLGWGILALNGWLHDIRCAAVKISKPASSAGRAALDASTAESGS